MAEEELLEIKIGDVKYRNPFFIASAPGSIELAQFEDAWNNGAGAIITKTIMDSDTKKSTKPTKEHQRRALWSPDHTIVYNQGSTAAEMGSIEEVAKDLATAMFKGIAIIPNIATKQVYKKENFTIDDFDYLKSFLPGTGGQSHIFNFLDKEKFVQTVSEIHPEYHGIFGGLVRRFTSKPASKSEIVEAAANCIDGLVDLSKLAGTMGYLSGLQQGYQKHQPDYRMNVEINMRYIMRSIEKHFKDDDMLLSSGDEYLSKNAQSTIMNPKKMFEVFDDIDPAFGELMRKGTEKNPKLRRDHFSRATGTKIELDGKYKEAVIRSIIGIGLLGEKFNLGLIAKFPYTSDFIDYALAAQEAGYVGITVVNTMKTPPHLRDLGDKSGVYQTKDYQVSGNALKDLSRLAISRARRNGITIPILASGGVAVDVLKTNPLLNTLDMLEELEDLKEVNNSVVGTRKSIDDLAKRIEAELNEKVELPAYLDSIDSTSKIQPLWAELSKKVGNGTLGSKLSLRKAKDDSYKLLRSAIKYQNKINLQTAADDVLDRLLLGATAIQLGTSSLAPPGFKSITPLKNILLEDVKKLHNKVLEYRAHEVYVNLLKRSSAPEDKQKYREHLMSRPPFNVDSRFDSNNTLGSIISFHLDVTRNKINLDSMNMTERMQELEKLSYASASETKKDNFKLSVKEYLSKIELLELQAKRAKNANHDPQEFYDEITQIKTEILTTEIMTTYHQIEKEDIMKTIGKLEALKTMGFGVSDIIGALEPVIAKKNIYTPRKAWVDPDLCTSCGDCYEDINYCTNIEPVDLSGRKKPIGYIQDSCDGCGTCAEFCTYDAIELLSPAERDKRDDPEYLHRRKLSPNELEKEDSAKARARIEEMLKEYRFEKYQKG